MIATCPHCQSGFYIIPDMAGQVMTCSKCKKQVRAPDRRGKGAPPLPDDGIPMANLAETRAETEERLKNETEARLEVEKKLNEETEARIKSEQLANELAEAKTQLEERLKETTEAKAALIERLNSAQDAQTDDEKSALIKAEITAREKAEESLRAAAIKHASLEEQLRIESQARTRAEDKLQFEAKAHAEDSERLKTESEARSLTEERLRTEIETRTRAEGEVAAEAKLRAEVERRVEELKKENAELDEKLRMEIQTRTKAEAQVKTETMSRSRVQSQMEADAAKFAKLEKELSAAHSRMLDTPRIRIGTDLTNFNKGLFRMSVVLSIAAGIFGGLFAYRNGYIINSHFDRPMALPFFSKSQLLPLNLIGIAIVSIALVWVGYFLIKFILKGFGGNVTTKVEKLPKVETPEPAQEEPVAAGSSRIWRSS